MIHPFAIQAYMGREALFKMVIELGSKALLETLVFWLMLMVELWALRDGLLLAKTFTIANLIGETWCLIYGAPPKQCKLITPLNLSSPIAGPFQ